MTTKDKSVLLASLAIIVFALTLQTHVINRNRVKLSNTLCKDCNVIFMSVDTLRAKSLPCYGNSINTAPNLCNLADKSYLFSDFHSQSAYTLDSHFSMITSQYPIKHGAIYPKTSGLSRESTTIAEVMGKNGYRTIYAGPTGSMHLPLDKGMERGFDDIIVASTPLDWINALSTLLPANRKYFAFMHTYYVHDPYTPSKRSLEKFYEGEIPDFPTNEDLCKQTYVSLKEKGRIADSNVLESNCEVLYSLQSTEDNEKRLEGGIIFKELSRINDIYINSFDKDLRLAMYESEIFEFDEMFGKFVNFLEDNHLLENTILVITSDHGEEFMEHGNWLHANNLYTESIDVPFIVYIPGGKGQVVDKLSQSIDIFPTILSLLDIKKPSSFQGIDLLSDEQNTYVYSNHFNDRIIAILSDKWKLIMNNDENKIELYNRLDDIEEFNNVYFENEDIANQLMAILLNYQKENSTIKQVKLEKLLPGWMDEEQRRVLIETGYF